MPLHNPDVFDLELKWTTIDSLGRRWSSHKHPRDSQGRFIETGGIARVGFRGLAKITRAMAGNKVEVQFSNGNRESVDARQLTMVRRPNGEKPTASRRKVAIEDERREQDPSRGDGYDDEDQGDEYADGIPDQDPKDEDDDNPDDADETAFKRSRTDARMGDYVAIVRRGADGKPEIALGKVTQVSKGKDGRYRPSHALMVGKRAPTSVVSENPTAVNLLPKEDVDGPDLLERARERGRSLGIEDGYQLILDHAEPHATDRTEIAAEPDDEPSPNGEKGSLTRHDGEWKGKAVRAQLSPSKNLAVIRERSGRTAFRLTTDDDPNAVLTVKGGAKYVEIGKPQSDADFRENYVGSDEDHGPESEGQARQRTARRLLARGQAADTPEEVRAVGQEAEDAGLGTLEVPDNRGRRRKLGVILTERMEQMGVDTRALAQEQEEEQAEPEPEVPQADAPGAPEAPEAPEESARRLHGEWREALAERERNSTDRTDAAEQAAYDALIDHIDANDLTYGEHDPRGPEPEGEPEQEAADQAAQEEAPAAPEPTPEAPEAPAEKEPEAGPQEVARRGAMYAVEGSKPGTFEVRGKTGTLMGEIKQGRNGATSGTLMGRRGKDTGADVQDVLDKMYASVNAISVEKARQAPGGPPAPDRDRAYPETPASREDTGRELRDDRGEALADVPAGGDREDEEPGGVLPRPGGEGRAEGERPDRRAAGEAGDGDGLPGEGGADRRGEPAGRGDRAGSGSVPAAGTGRRGQRATPAAEQGALHDDGEPDAPGVAPNGDPHAAFRPRTQDDLNPRGEMAQARANIAAIRKLHELEQENRAATAEEKQTLARWSSWGNLSEQMFNPTAHPEFKPLRDELKSLLSQKEWDDARRTVKNAHYTDAYMVQAMWDAMDDLGFDGGTVLEPGSGLGTFIGMAPDNANMVGVELDSTTARISAKLYPEANIVNKGFERLDVTPGSLDGAIGNVPFSEERLPDPTGGNDGNHVMHDHFILKALKGVKPGGVAMMLTSSGTLDKSSTKARKDINEEADFLGAVRLPSGAHQRAAGTKVVTDVLLFRKRAEGEKPRGHKFVSRQKVTDRHGNDLQVNSYFAQHPENVLGHMELGRSMYGEAAEMTVTSDNLADTPAQLQAALRGIVRDAKDRGLGIESERAQAEAADLAAFIRDADARDEETHITAHPDGTFTIVENGREVPLAVPKSRADEVRHLMRLRDINQALLKEERLNTRDTVRMHQLREELNDVYDDYARKYKAIHRTKWVNAAGIDPQTGEKRRRRSREIPAVWRKDRMYSLVDALENYNVETGQRSKAAIFSQRVIRPAAPKDRVDNPEDALAVSMDQLGRVDLPKIATLLGVGSPEEAREALGRLVFTDPKSGRLLHGEEYLSGDVRTKLKEARALARTNPEFENNVTELERVVPDDIRADQINARPGAPWLPLDVLTQYARERFQDPWAEVTNPGGGSGWDVKVATTSENELVTRQQFGLEGSWHAGKIFQSVIQQSPITVTYTVDGKTYKDHFKTVQANNRARAILADFKKWLWEDEARSERLTELYNDRMNFLAEKDFTRRRVTLRGLSQRFKRLFNHQHAAIARISSEPTVLLAHEVGAGKTLEMQAGSMKLRELGLANKPSHVVPNHMLEQYAREFIQAFPDAKVLVAQKSDLSGSGAADTARKREAFAARAANGDWDAVIFTHSAFELMPMSPDEQENYLQREVGLMRAELESRMAAGGKDAPSVKRLQKRLDKYEAKVRKKIQAAREKGGVTFEDTGIDYMFVDEAHLFKNLMTQSRIQGANIAGSNRASDIHMKLDYLRLTKPEGARVGTFATATPISNSMTEAYTMQRFMRPDLLVKTGTMAFDRWASAFGEVVAKPEVDVTGQSQKMNARFRKFSNIPELLRMFREFADVKLAADLDLPTPALRDGKPKTIMVDPSDVQGEYLASLGERAKAIAAGGVKPEDDNLLKISGDGRKAALDMRLVGISDPESPKVAAAANQITSIWQKNRGNRYKVDKDSEELHDTPGALQLVFMDLGTPKEPTPPSVNKLAAKMEPIQTRISAGELSRDGGRAEALEALKKLKRDDLEVVGYELGLETDDWDEDTTKGEIASEVLEQLIPEDDDLPLRPLEVVEFDPNDPPWSAYKELKDNLVKRGIPAEQVRFIHEANDDAKKAALFADAREGRVQVLIGSTSKMGVGTNVQDRAIAIHHMDVPWRPADLTQRDGRIIRQGNQNAEIDVYRYVTKGSFDSFMWQGIARKTAFINAAMKGDMSVREIDDLSAEELDAAEIVAVSANNPWLMRKAAADAKLQELTSALDDHHRQVRQASSSVDRYMHQAERYEADLPPLQAAVKKVQPTAGDKFKATIAGEEGEEFTSRTQADEALKNVLAEQFTNPGEEVVPGYYEWKPVGSVAGLELRARKRTPGDQDLFSSGQWMEVGFEGLATNTIPVEVSDLDPKSPARPFQSLESAAARLATSAERTENNLKVARDNIERAKAASKQQFTQGPELEKAREHADLIDRIIVADANLPDTEPEKPDESYLAQKQELDEMVAEERDLAGASGEDEASSLLIVDPDEPLPVADLPPLEHVESATVFYERAKPSQAAWKARADELVDSLTAGEDDPDPEAVEEAVRAALSASDPDVSLDDVADRVRAKLRANARKRRGPSPAPEGTTDAQPRDRAPAVRAPAPQPVSRGESEDPPEVPADPDRAVAETPAEAFGPEQVAQDLADLGVAPAEPGAEAAPAGDAQQRIDNAVDDLGATEAQSALDDDEPTTSGLSNEQRNDLLDTLAQGAAEATGGDAAEIRDRLDAADRGARATAGDPVDRPAPVAPAPAVADAAPSVPGIEERDKTWFTGYRCGDLAWTLHQQTGWPIHLVSDDPDPERSTVPGWLHAGVMTPDGQFLDVNGLHDPDELLDDWIELAEDPEDLDLLPVDADAFHGQDDGATTGRAAKVAQTLMGHLGIEPVEGAPNLAEVPGEPEQTPERDAAILRDIEAEGDDDLGDLTVRHGLDSQELAQAAERARAARDAAPTPEGAGETLTPEEVAGDLESIGGAPQAPGDAPETPAVAGDPDRYKGLSKNQRRILEIIDRDGEATSNQIARETGIYTKDVARSARILQERGLVRSRHQAGATVHVSGLRPEPKFGDRLGDPHFVQQAGGGAHVYETLAGREPGKTVPRLLWRIEKRDGVWGVYPPPEQAPASFSAGTKGEAEKWAMDRANGIPDPEAEEAPDETPEIVDTPALTGELAGQQMIGGIEPELQMILDDEPVRKQPDRQIEGQTDVFGQVAESEQAAAAEAADDVVPELPDSDMVVVYRTLDGLKVEPFEFWEDAKERGDQLDPFAPENGRLIPNLSQEDQDRIEAAGFERSAGVFNSDNMPAVIFQREGTTPKYRPAGGDGGGKPPETPGAPAAAEEPERQPGAITPGETRRSPTDMSPEDMEAEIAALNEQQRGGGFTTPVVLDPTFRAIVDRRKALDEELKQRRRAAKQQDKADADAAERAELLEGIEFARRDDGDSDVVLNGETIGQVGKYDSRSWWWEDPDRRGPILYDTRQDAVLDMRRSQAFRAEARAAEAPEAPAAAEAPDEERDAAIRRDYASGDYGTPGVTEKYGITEDEMWAAINRAERAAQENARARHAEREQWREDRTPHELTTAGDVQVGDIVRRGDYDYRVTVSEATDRGRFWRIDGEVVNRPPWANPDQDPPLDVRGISDSQQWHRVPVEASEDQGLRATYLGSTYADGTPVPDVDETTAGGPYDENGMGPITRTPGALHIDTALGEASIVRSQDGSWFLTYPGRFNPDDAYPTQRQALSELRGFVGSNYDPEADARTAELRAENDRTEAELVAAGILPADEPIEEGGATPPASAGPERDAATPGGLEVDDAGDRLADLDTDAGAGTVYDGDGNRVGTVNAHTADDGTQTWAGQRNDSDEPVTAEHDTPQEAARELAEASDGPESDPEPQPEPMSPESQTRMADDAPAEAEEAYEPKTPERLEGEKFPLTGQQQRIADAVVADRLDTLVTAKAGTGKTSTLEAIARRLKVLRPEDRAAYIAFNKSVQTEAEARMPDNVEPRTGHSISFVWAGRDYTDARFRNSKALRQPDDIARHLGINRSLDTGHGESLSRTEQAQAAIKAVDTYSNSADDEIGVQHLPERWQNLPPEATRALLGLANKAWDDIRRKDGRLNVTNDHIRKMWALSRPDLSKPGSGLRKPATVLFLDEAQDTPPVLAKVVADQTIQKVIVGDADQAIYGFTGATDYLSSAEADLSLPLTKSWRFGPEVADMGNRFLQVLGSNERVEGGGPSSNIVSDMQGADAILVRSNGGMIGEIVRELGEGRTVGVPKGTKQDLRSLIESARYLRGEGRAPRTMHDDLAPYRTWGEVMEAANKGDDQKLAMLTRLVGDYGLDELDRIVGQIQELGDGGGLDGLRFSNDEHGLVAGGNTFKHKDALKQAGFRWMDVPGQRKKDGTSLKAWTATGTDEEREAKLARAREIASGGEPPDVVVSTAHKAKGLEWGRVRIGDDFRGPEEDKQTGEKIMPSPEELRLAYVAVTRAEKELDPGSLAWVMPYSDPNGGTPGARRGETLEPEQVQSDLADLGAEAPEAPEAPAAPEPEAAPESGRTFGDLGVGDTFTDGDKTWTVEQVTPGFSDDRVTLQVNDGEGNRRNRMFRVDDALPEPGQPAPDMARRPEPETAPAAETPAEGDLPRVDTPEGQAVFERSAEALRRERPPNPGAEAVAGANIAGEHHRRMAEHYWHDANPYGQFDTTTEWAVGRLDSDEARQIVAGHAAALRDEMRRIQGEARDDYAAQLRAAGDDPKAAHDVFYGTKGKGGKVGVQSDETHQLRAYDIADEAIESAVSEAEAAGVDADAVRAAMEQITGHGGMVSVGRGNEVRAWHRNVSQPIDSLRGDVFEHMNRLQGGDSQRDMYRSMLEGSYRPLKVGDTVRLDRPAGKQEWRIESFSDDGDTATITRGGQTRDVPVDNLALIAAREEPEAEEAPEGAPEAAPEREATPEPEAPEAPEAPAAPATPVESYEDRQVTDTPKWGKDGGAHVLRDPETGVSVRVLKDTELGMGGYNLEQYGADGELIRRGNTSTLKGAKEFGEKDFIELRGEAASYTRFPDAATLPEGEWIDRGGVRAYRVGDAVALMWPSSLDPNGYWEGRVLNTVAPDAESNRLHLRGWDESLHRAHGRGTHTAIEEKIAELAPHMAAVADAWNNFDLARLNYRGGRADDRMHASELEAEATDLQDALDRMQGADATILHKRVSDRLDTVNNELDQKGRQRREGDPHYTEISDEELAQEIEKWSDRPEYAHYQDLLHERDRREAGGAYGPYEDGEDDGSNVEFSDRRPQEERLGEPEVERDKRWARERAEDDETWRREYEESQRDREERDNRRRRRRRNRRGVNTPDDLPNVREPDQGDLPFLPDQTPPAATAGVGDPGTGGAADEGGDADGPDASGTTAAMLARDGRPLYDLTNDELNTERASAQANASLSDVRGMPDVAMRLRERIDAIDGILRDRGEPAGPEEFETAGAITDRMPEPGEVFTLPDQPGKRFRMWEDAFAGVIATDLDTGDRGVVPSDRFENGWFPDEPAESAEDEEESEEDPQRRVEEMAEQAQLNGADLVDRLAEAAEEDEEVYGNARDDLDQAVSSFSVQGLHADAADAAERALQSAREDGVDDELADDLEAVAAELRAVADADAARRGIGGPDEEEPDEEEPEEEPEEAPADRWEIPQMLAGSDSNLKSKAPLARALREAAGNTDSPEDKAAMRMAANALTRTDWNTYGGPAAQGRDLADLDQRILDTSGTTREQLDNRVQAIADLADHLDNTQQQNITLGDVKVARAKGEEPRVADYLRSYADAYQARRAEQADEGRPEAPSAPETPGEGEAMPEAPAAAQAGPEPAAGALEPEPVPAGVAVATDARPEPLVNGNLPTEDQLLPGTGPDGRYEPEQIEHMADYGQEVLAAIDDNWHFGTFNKPTTGDDGEPVYEFMSVLSDEPIHVTPDGLQAVQAIDSAEIPGAVTDPTDLRPGTRVVGRVGSKPVTGVLEGVTDDRRAIIRDSLGEEHRTKRGGTVRPIHGAYAPGMEPTQAAFAPRAGIWTDQPDGRTIAGAPGEWLGQIVPDGQGGYTWQVDGYGPLRGQSLSGTADSLEAAKRALDDALESWTVEHSTPLTMPGNNEDERDSRTSDVAKQLADLRGEEPTTPDGDTEEPATEPEPVQGQNAAWVDTGTLEGGDVARVDGDDGAGNSTTRTGHVLGAPEPVTVHTPGGETRNGHRTPVGAERDGQTADRGAVLTPDGAVAARAQRDDEAGDLDTPRSVGESQVLSESLAEQVPVDSNGVGVFPRSLVTDRGGRSGVVTEVGARDVAVRWADKDRDQRVQPGTLTVSDEGHARPPGWTAGGSRVRPGQVVSDGDGRQGVVESVNGDTVTLGGPDGRRDVPAADVSVAQVAKDDADAAPQQVTVTPTPVADLSAGDVVLMPGGDGSLNPWTVTSAEERGDRVDLELADPTTGEVQVLDTDRSETIGVATDAATGKPVDTSGVQRSPLSAPTGPEGRDVRPVEPTAPEAYDEGTPTSAVVLSPEMRRALDDLGLDTDQTSPFDVQQAAARIRHDLPVSSQQAEALAGFLRELAQTGESTGRPRMLNRIANRAEAASLRANQGDLEPESVADLADVSGPAVPTKPADLVEGDTVAIPHGNDVETGTVVGTTPELGGAVVQVETEAPDGTRNTTAVPADADLHVLPETPEETPQADLADVDGDRAITEPRVNTRVTEAAENVVEAALEGAEEVDSLDALAEHVNERLDDGADDDAQRRSSDRFDYSLDGSGVDPEEVEGTRQAAELTAGEVAADTATMMRDTLADAEPLPGESQSDAAKRWQERMRRVPRETATDDAVNRAFDRQGADTGGRPTGREQRAADRDIRDALRSDLFTLADEIAALGDIQSAQALSDVAARLAGRPDPLQLEAATRAAAMGRPPSLIRSLVERVRAMFRRAREGFIALVQRLMGTGRRAKRSLRAALRAAQSEWRGDDAAVTDLVGDAAEHIARGGDKALPEAEQVPGSFPEQVRAWNDRLPGDLNDFGHAQGRSWNFGRLTRAGLEAGGNVTGTPETSMRLDRAADGGPGQTATGHVEAVKGLGASVDEQVMALVRARLPELGENPPGTLAEGMRLLDDYEAHARDDSSVEGPAADVRNAVDTMRRAYANAVADAALEVLGQVREMGPRGTRRLRINGDPEAVAALRWAEQHFPTEWLAAAGPIEARVGRRPTYDGAGKITVDAIPEARDGAGEYGTSALMHLADHIAASLPGLEAAQWAYHWQRTSDGPQGRRRRRGKNALGSLADLFPGLGMRARDVAREGDYPLAWMGREFGQDRPLALMPVALDELFAGEFYKDDDIRRFMLGLLAYTGRR